MKKVKVIYPKQEPIEEPAEGEVVLPEPIVEEVVETAPVVEVPVVAIVDPIAISKIAQIPVLQIEEVARGFRQYRPHHLQAILSFCNARGYPLQGTKEQLLNTLQQFGW